MTRPHEVLIYAAPEGDVRVDDMTREQLLELVHELHRELESAREGTRVAFRLADMWRNLRK